MSGRILVIEDDASIRAMLERGLRVAGYEPTFAATLSDGRALWEAGDADVVLLDQMLPDGRGIDLLAERRAAGDHTPTVVLTAREDDELRRRTLASGASDYLGKPFAYGELLARLARLLPQA